MKKMTQGTTQGVKSLYGALIEFNGHTPQEQEIIVDQSLDRMWKKFERKGDV